MKANNISVHEETEYTPHELVFARSANVSTSSVLPDDKSNESYPEYAHYSSEYSTPKHSNKNAKYAKIRSKRYYDSKANSQIFNKNDYIYLKELLRNKFDEQYKGPYKILKILENNNIKLAINGQELCIVIR